MIPLVRLADGASGLLRCRAVVEDIRQAFDAAKHNALVAHRHDYFEIFIVRQGRGVVATDEGPVMVDPRHVCVLPPGAVHSWTAWRGLDGYLLRVPTTSTEQIAGLILPTTLTVASASPDQMQRLLVLAEWLHVEQLDGSCCGKLIFDTRLRLLALEVMALTGVLTLNECTNVKQLMYDRFLTLVESNFRMHLKVPEYAERLRIGKERLAKITQEIADKTPGAIIKDRVMSEALTLVTRSDSRLGVIAEGLGFPSLAYFSRAFRQATGVSASALRRRPQNDKSRHQRDNQLQS